MARKSRAKYRPGLPLDTSLAIFLILRGEHVFWNHKCQNSSWMRGQQLNVIDVACRKKTIRQAIKIEENENGK